MPQTLDAAPPHAARSEQRTDGKRDPLLDNAKFLAIVLVVVEHAWEPLRGHDAVRAAYVLVYAFHMPVFILIAGFLTRNFSTGPDKMRSLSATVVVSYLLFETAYTAFRRAAGGKVADLSLLQPGYLAWFLLALFAWWLTAPVWKVLRWPVAVAVVVSLVAGTSELAAETLLKGEVMTRAAGGTAAAPGAPAR